jgi:hypothetical protein
MRPIVVTYDTGAVSPQEIAHGLDGLGPLVFLVPDTAHVRRVREVLDHLGTVLPLTHQADADTAVIRALQPAAMLTFSESLLRTTAMLAHTAGLPFHDMQTAQVLTDKRLQRQRLRDAGVDDVRYHPLTSAHDWPAAAAHVGLPAVIKPVHGAASRHTHLVTDLATGARLLGEIFDSRHTGAPAPLMTAEEYLGGVPDLPFGDYVSVESLCEEDTVHHVAVTGKFPLSPPFREVGRFWPALLRPDEREAVLRLTTRALHALGVIVGLTHTELKLTAAGPRIIEVNGRLGGHVNGLARTATRTDLVRMAGLRALGRPQRTAVTMPEQVHFQLHGLAPTVPCRLAGVHGAARVRQMPGITGYRGFVPVGELLPGGVPTLEMDVLWGAASDHQAMRDVLDQALPQLTYEFALPDGPRRVNAAELLQWDAGAEAMAGSTPVGHA